MSLQKFFEKVFKKAPQQEQEETLQVKQTEIKNIVNSLFKENTPASVLYYCPGDLVDSQIYSVLDSSGKSICRISASKSGKNYYVFIRNAAGALIGGCLYKGIFGKKTVASWTKVPVQTFIQELEFIKGDKELKRILTEMFDPKRDTFITKSESHFIIKRNYESCSKKWAEVVITTNPKSNRKNGVYTIKINCGRDSRSFIKMQELQANYPYRIIKDSLSILQGNTLF